MRLRCVTFSIFLGLASGAQAQIRKATGHADRVVARPPVTYEPAAIANPSQADVSPGDKGSAVVRAQILLNRLHFSCGEIDGNFGSNLQKTLAAFQDNRKLPPTGIVDAATRAVLNADTAPVLSEYMIAETDETGPFIPLPNTMSDQAKLETLAYSSPLEELSERFHASPALLKALNPGADFSRVGQALTVPNTLVLPPTQAASIVVTKSESSVRAYDADGKLLAFYMATTGSEHDPLPLGDWKVVGQRRNPDFHYDASLFWDAKVLNEKAVIRPGPNNPVGVVWIDLSKPHYGIHGTPEPSLIGHAQSHGCIRLTNWDAWELSSIIKPGTPAILKE